MTTGILLLAAGRAVRFGADKRLATLPDGRSVIYATLGNIHDSGLPLLVCLGEGDDALAQDLRQRQTNYLCCGRAVEGIGATLAEGVGHIQDWAGVLVALADMPWISSATYRAVAARLSPDCIAIPVHGGRRGHPVGFGRSFFPLLSALGGDVGARGLLNAYAARVTEVEVADVGIHRDIDVPTDLLLT